MGTLRVRDIMTDEVITVPTRADREAACRMLLAQRIGGAPVVDDTGRVIGIVTLRDLLHPLNRPATGLRRAVDAVMTRVVYTVQPGDPVMTVVRLMIEEDIHRAVVVENDDTLVGIVTRLDILRALARGDGVQDGDYAAEMHHEVHGDPAVAVGDRVSVELVI